MQEDKKDQSDEKLLILPLGEESKKITQVISNDTARQIIELLADAPLSASDIAERLQSPLTTVTYNLENLESVGLVRIERIKYSEKGREVKIYAPVRKLIVVVPEKTDRKSAIDILKKYLGVILAATLVSGIMEFLTRIAGNNKPEMTRVQDSGMPHALINETPEGLYGGLSVTPTPADMASSIPPAIKSVPTTPMPTSVYEAVNSSTNSAGPALEKGAAPDILSRIIDTIAVHPALMFLLGCLFVIAILVVLDLRRKNKK